MNRFTYTQSTLKTNDNIPDWKWLRNQNFKKVYEEENFLLNEVTLFI